MKQKMTKKSVAVPFTPEELRTLQRTAYRVWEIIGSDIMAAVTDDEDGDGSGAIPRDHVIELVLDAGRLEAELRRGRGSRDHHPQLADKVSALYTRKGGYKAMIAAVKPAFPYEEYS